MLNTSTLCVILCLERQFKSTMDQKVDKAIEALQSLYLADSTRLLPRKHAKTVAI